MLRHSDLRLAGDATVDVDYEVGTDLGAELASGTAREEARNPIALRVHVVRHDEDAGRTHVDAEHAALATLDVDHHAGRSFCPGAIPRSSPAVGLRSTTGRA